MGLALWGETRRWRNLGRALGGGKGADPWDCAPVCPGADFVGWWGVGRELNPVPSSTQEAPGVGPDCSACILPGSYLACRIQGKQTWGSGLCR